jgi:hypothetical protein
MIKRTEKINYKLISHEEALSELKKIILEIKNQTQPEVNPLETHPN